MTTDSLVFNGINGTTGEYLLPPLTASQAFQLAQGFGLDDEQQPELKARQFGLQPSYAVKEGVDPNDLAQTGWAVIFARGADPAIKAALTELLSYRQEQAGDRFRVFDGADGYQPGESKDDFLVRHGAGPGPADPDRVPYYLLLVGDPEAIPYRFQYQLDVQYGVGRIHFDTLEEYARYARSVVEAERGGAVLSRRLAFFGVRNPGDEATRLSADELVAPLAGQLAEQFGTGAAPWTVDRFLADEATKDRLAALLGGPETPALLFTASHGMGFDLKDQRQAAHQGALLCQEWAGPDLRGEITQDFYFAADDIADNAKLLGLIAFHFACFGAGTPRLDDFAHLGFGPRSAIARRAFVAPLPRRLLSHPGGGALAVIGHVERAWGYSFYWGRAGRQPEAFRSTLHRLLDGHRVGSALEPLNGRYSELSTMLSTELEDVKTGKVPNDVELGQLWVATNDARGYAVIGDPAVRLVVGEAPADGVRPTIAPVRISKAPSAATAPSDAAGTPVSAAVFGPVDWLRGDSPMRDAVTHLAGTVQEFADRLGDALMRTIDEASSLTVKTYVSDDLSAVGDDFSGPATLRVMTRMTLDGDTEVYLPQAAAGLPEGLWEMHADMVQRAQANRAELLKAAVGAATGLLGAVRGG